MPCPPFALRRWSLRRAFTLVEILVSVTILLLIMVVLFQLTATLGSVWVSSKGKISAFENARLAFGTLNATLGRATLNTYVDYINIDSTSGARTYRNLASSATDPSSPAKFVPTAFARASELHFLSGPATDVLAPVYDPANGNDPGDQGFFSASSPPLPTTAANPGHAIFFQAPLGVTSAANFNGMNRLMNSVGFYIQYGPPPPGLYPNWMSTGANSASSKDYRFRLVQFVEPSENLGVYFAASLANYDSGWINFGSIVNTSTNPTGPGGLTKPRARVLAEDVLLLIFRPRLSATDEKAAAAYMGTGYTPSTDLNSVLCPNYQYDSRAWMSGYPTSTRVRAANYPDKRVLLMCNQSPPIVDVAMVCADPQSLVRFGRTSTTPPTAIPTAAGLFSDSSKMEKDLTTYAQRLSDARIHFHIMRNSVEIESARWSNN